jgi:nitroreductase
MTFQVSLLLHVKWAGKEGDNEMAEFSDLLKGRRSIRDFQEKEVPLDLVKEMIKESCFAPSSANGQPWRFIIVNNKEWIQRLSDESKKNLLAFLDANPDSPLKKYEEALKARAFNIFYNAPCLIFFGGSGTVWTIQVDCALAACYFMFSAVQRGLGTCWVGLGTNIRDPWIKNQIGMEGDYQIVAPIIVGYPRSIPDTQERAEPQILRIVS